MNAANNILETQSKPSGVFDQITEMEHEQLVFCYDKASGLKSIISVHNTILGPALGGTRFWNYESEQDAVTDALRLSRGMTLKASISGLNLGGGKAVIIGNSYKDKSEALWRSYGRFVESLSGKYITAEDVGTSVQDMEYIAMETEHVVGRTPQMGGGGDPSPVTAYGTYLGMKASAKERWGNDSLNGKKVAVQGIGHVGEYLVELLSKEDARIYISDINDDRLKRVSKKYGAEVVAPEEIYDLDMDIYAPCALGATVNDDTLERLKCSIIAGAANNQLADEQIHGNVLREKGILYAPDFLINAGGLINCYAELEGYNRERAMARTEIIYSRTLEIYEKSKAENLTTHQAAQKVARERIDMMAKVHCRM
jgi:leucine dehydrogenase